MNATPGPAAPAAGDEATAPRDDSIAPLAAGAGDVVAAWAGLLNLEVALAQRSLRRLLIGAIVVPVVGLSGWLCLSALLVALIHVYADSWLLALLFGTGVQLLALAILLKQLRIWSHDLTLPRSRAALARAMERMA